MANSPEEDERLAIRRGVEHIRVKGTTEEMGEIVPSPVVTENEAPDRARDDDDES